MTLSHTTRPDSPGGARGPQIGRSCRRSAKSRGTTSSLRTFPLGRCMALAAALMIASHPAQAEEASLSLDTIARQSGQTLAIEPPSLPGLGARSASLSVVFRNAGQSWSDSRREDKSLVILQEGRLLAETTLSASRWSYDIPLARVPGTAPITMAMLDEAGACVAANLPDVIDLASSRIRATLATSQIRLDAIPALLGPAFPEDRPFIIWSPYGLDGKNRLTAALSVAEGFALAFRGDTPRIDVRKLKPSTVRHAGALAGVDVSHFRGPLDVVIGTTTDLENWISPETLSEITGPYVGISALPGSTSSWIVILSGRDRAEVEAAAAVFSNESFTWPAGRAVILAENSTPERIMTLPGAAWGPDHPSFDPSVYTFESLGYPTTTETQDIRIPIVVMLGADDLDPNAEVVIRPSFVYGPGYRADASWQAYVGDHFMGSVSLSASGGSTTGTAEIRIPVRNLKAGANELRLVPSLPEARTNCLAPSADVPATWLGDGTIEAPWLGGGRIRASLAAWTTTGHLNPAALERPVRIVVESSEDQTIAAALTIAARITKSARHPIPGLVLAEGNSDAPDADLVLVGTHEWAASILKLDPEQTPDQLPPWLSQGLDEAAKVFSQGDGRDQLLDYLADAEDAGGAATVFGWSTRDGQSVVTAAFTSEATIREEAYRLVDEQNWNDLAGDYYRLPEPGAEPTVLAVADPDSTAASQNPDPFVRIHSWVLDAARTAPGRVGLVVFVALIGLVLALRLAVSSKRARNAERRRD